MISFKKVALVPCVIILLGLSGCSAADNADGFGFSQKGETFYSEGLFNSSSGGTTLEGATLEDKNSGWSIRELEPSEVPKEISERNAIKLLDSKLYLEAGGGESSECRSNFEEIQYNAEAASLFLVHQLGNQQTEECSAGYREAFFELTPGDNHTLEGLEEVEIYEQTYSASKEDKSVLDIQTVNTYVYIKEDWR